MALPAVMSYCKVSYQLLEATADTSDDLDELPQGNPLVGAQISFSAAPSAIKTSAPPATTITRRIECLTDASGYLYNPAGTTLDGDGNAVKRGVYILASDDPDIEPHDWSWYFKVYRDDLPSISGSFIATADGEIDLATVVNVPASPGAETAAWIAAVTAATDARDAAQAARDAAVEAAAHPSDPAVAALIDDPDSQVRASLSSTYVAKAGLSTNADVLTAVRATGSYADATAAANSRTLMGLLHRGASNAQMLVIGDSTGNATDEWVYGLGAWLGSLYPAYTVTYYHWDETGGAAYEAPITIQTGTGAVTLTIYNCSVAGQRPGYVLGSRWAAAVASLAPDLILISHGHNTGGAPPTDNSPRFTLKGGASESLVQLVAHLGLTHPATPITAIAQNPSGIVGRETWQAIKASIYERGASVYGYGLIDVHQAFIDYGAWNPALMTDAQHPNATGQALWLEVVKQAFRPQAMKGTPARWMPSPLTRYQPNLAPNPLFASWASTNPDSWGTFTFCAPTKDTTNFETGSYGMKLTTDSNSGQALAELSVPITDKPWLKGKLVTVAARIRVPASNTSTVRVTAYDDGGATPSSAADMDATCRDGFVWMFAVHRVSAVTNNIRIRISPRTTGTAVTECTVDRVWIGEGILPNVASIS